MSKYGPSHYMEAAMRKHGEQKNREFGIEREKTIGRIDKEANSFNRDSKKEDSQAFLYDNREALKRLEPKIDRLHQTKDVGDFIQGVAPGAAVELAAIAFGVGDPKVRLAAIQDLLDRAGHGKVQKHAIASVSAADSRDTLMSIITGGDKTLIASGIEIVDDDEPNEAATDQDQKE